MYTVFYETKVKHIIYTDFPAGEVYFHPIKHFNSVLICLTQDLGDCQIITCSCSCSFVWIITAAPIQSWKEWFTYV